MKMAYHWLFDEMPHERESRAKIDEEVANSRMKDDLKKLLKQLEGQNVKRENQATGKIREGTLMYGEWLKGEETFKKIYRNNGELFRKPNEAGGKRGWYVVASENEAYFVPIRADTMIYPDERKISINSRKQTVRRIA